MAFIDTRDGTRLFVNDWGAGKPIVLIHGWPLSSGMWDYQAAYLASQGLRVVTYDRRGFGRSDQPWTGYDYNTLADDLADVIDGLKLQDATLVGFSMGGGEVVRYLRRHGPAKVARAALVAAVTPYLLQTAEHPEGAPASLFEGMVSGLEADRPHFLAGFGKKFMGSGLLNFSVSADYLQSLLTMALAGSQKATVDCVRAFGMTDFRADMAALTMPTLIVHGTADETVPIDISGRVAAKMVPHATFLEYKGAPHGLHFTEKDRLNADLLAFVKG